MIVVVVQTGTINIFLLRGLQFRRAWLVRPTSSRDGFFESLINMKNKG